MPWQCRFPSVWKTMCRVVVDLVGMKALYFEGGNGEIVREVEIPSYLLEEAKAKREELIDAASLFPMN